MEPVTEPFDDFEDVSADSLALRCPALRRERGESEESLARGERERDKDDEASIATLVALDLDLDNTQLKTLKNKPKHKPTGLRRRSLRGLPSLDPLWRPLGRALLPSRRRRGPRRDREQLPEAAAGEEARRRGPRRHGRRFALCGAGLAVLRGGGREGGAPCCCCSGEGGEGQEGEREEVKKKTERERPQPALLKKKLFRFSLLFGTRERIRSPVSLSDFKTRTTPRR